MSTAGAESAITGSLDAVRRGGTAVLVGLANEAKIPLDVLSSRVIRS